MSQGFEITLSVDANKCTIKGKLAKYLTNLGLKEAYYHKFKKTGPDSYFIA